MFFSIRLPFLNRLVSCHVDADKLSYWSDLYCEGFSIISQLTYIALSLILASVFKCWMDYNLFLQQVTCYDKMYVFI